MQTFLNITGALYSDGTIPEREKADARITLVMTLEEAQELASWLVIANWDDLVASDKDAWARCRSMRRSLKEAYR